MKIFLTLIFVLVSFIAYAQDPVATISIGNTDKVLTPSIEDFSSSIPVPKGTNTMTVVMDVTKHTDPGNCVHLTIYLSKDGGVTFPNQGSGFTRCGQPAVDKNGNPISTQGIKTFSQNGLGDNTVAKIGIVPLSGKSLQTSSSVIMEKK